MTGQLSQESKTRLMKLFWPLFLEMFFVMLAGTVDTLMLSSEGDLAVGAVGTANSYMSIIINLFNIGGTGMVATMSYYIGAGKRQVAHSARNIGLVFNGALGGIFSFLFFIGTRTFLKLAGIAESILDLTADYLSIVGSGCILNAMITIFSGHLRAFGLSKKPFQAAMVGNVVNIVLNAYFLYVKKAGVAGVAAATVISRIVNLMLLVLWSQKLYQAPEKSNMISNRRLFREILKIGLPAALENTAYVISVSITVSIINIYDASGFSASARSYALTVATYTHCASLSFGQANGIVAGWLMGEGKADECSVCTKISSAYSCATALLFGSLLTLSSPLYMKSFSQNPDMQAIVTVLVAINIILELGRAVNVCYAGALKATGDAIYPMIIVIIFGYLVGAGGTWLLCGAIGLNPAIAAFISMAADECIRGVFMILRWRTGTWRNKGTFRL